MAGPAVPIAVGYTAEAVQSHIGRGPAMESLKFVGLDVHAESVAIAVAEKGLQPAMLGTFANDVPSLVKRLRRLGNVRCCYEAGPTGYGLQRALAEAGVECIVIAPSLVPSAPGEHVKTDRRDAVKRRTAWSQEHLKWLRSQRFDHDAQRCVFDDAMRAIEEATARVMRLTASIRELVQRSSLAPIANALQSFRGIDFLSATIIAAEVGDLRRFSSAPQFMSYLGLVPAERSSGNERRQGAITRAGNGHVRRILTEAAWAYRYRPTIGRALRKRSVLASEAVRRIAWQAQARLCMKRQRLIARGKPANKVATAIARELAGFIWSLGQVAQLITP